VKACGVNFVDALFVNGTYQIKPSLPFTPGSELAGLVTEVGSEVDGVAVGDLVSANLGLGAFADEVVVSQQQVTLVPASMSPAIAASINQSYSTAWFSLFDRGNLVPGETVVVLGAGGGVGLASVDVAKHAGARVIAAASSADKLEAAAALGADHLINYTEVDLKPAVRELAPNGVELVLDPIGGPLGELAVRLLGFDGRLMVVGFASGAIPNIPANQVLLRNRRVIGVDWGWWAMTHPAEQAELFSRVLGAIAKDQLHPPTPTSYPLDHAGQALRDLQERRVTGKIVLIP
jgi:NADPH2:quinone reductase